MIKRTLYFGNPAYLSLCNSQLRVQFPDVPGEEQRPDVSISIEDLGMIVLDDQRITITHGAIQALQENNTAILTCDSRHMPQSLVLPLEGHSTQQERYDDQLKASEPMKKNLWAQTVSAKIRNQARVLEELNLDHEALFPLYKNVKSGDSGNHEASAARHYWQELFSHIEGFNRYREGPPPNNWLNYGYAILRATMARSIVGAGLLPTLGIFHRNRYNAFCLADDLMEAYRPMVDRIVYEMTQEHETSFDLNKDQKAILLRIPALDVLMDGEKSPLMIATQRTAVSLVKCYSGEQRKLSLPEIMYIPDHIDPPFRDTDPPHRKPIPGY
jgi:CRISPR-associated protein Cas1